MSRASALEKPDAQPRRKVLALDWKQAAHYLDAKGFAVLPKLLTQAECTALTALYSDNSQFRSRIDMTRHGFGRGEYKYFSYPLPALIADLRTALYPPLADVANRWNAAMGIDVRYPPSMRNFSKRCHAAGPDAADAAAAEVRRRRLQLPASGPLRRARLSTAGRHPAFGARPRFHRRRVRADRTAPAHAIAGCRSCR